MWYRSPALFLFGDISQAKYHSQIMLEHGGTHITTTCESLL